MKTIISDGNKVEVKSYGTEKVFYNGELVSKKFSMLGSTHTFNADENNRSIQYDIQIGTRWHGFSFWLEVRKEGKIIFTDR